MINMAGLQNKGAIAPIHKITSVDTFGHRRAVSAKKTTKSPLKNVGPARAEMGTGSRVIRFNTAEFVTARD
jgi:hypothetical protein